MKAYYVKYDVNQPTTQVVNLGAYEQSLVGIKVQLSPTSTAVPNVFDDKGNAIPIARTSGRTKSGHFLYMIDPTPNPPDGRKYTVVASNKHYFDLLVKFDKSNATESDVVAEASTYAPGGVKASTVTDDEAGVYTTECKISSSDGRLYVPSSIKTEIMYTKGFTLGATICVGIADENQLVDGILEFFTDEGSWVPTSGTAYPGLWQILATDEPEEGVKTVQIANLSKGEMFTLTHYAE